MFKDSIDSETAKYMEWLGVVLIILSSFWPIKYMFATGMGMMIIGMVVQDKIKAMVFRVLFMGTLWATTVYVSIWATIIILVIGTAWIVYSLGSRVKNMDQSWMETTKNEWASKAFSKLGDKDLADKYKKRAKDGDVVNTRAENSNTKADD